MPLVGKGLKGAKVKEKEKTEKKEDRWKDKR